MTRAMHLQAVKNKAERKARAERHEQLARANRATAESLAHLASIQAMARGEIFWVNRP